ncbi:hypothetical protein GMAR_ORF64 [Golden Marseillevirus]|uniref:hypothetical protein n=1 Tax=Golden Marseillevirus TaxID=1720526 RepID=UPI000877AEA8|nr:hypothetical protein GMAR_ORF64 [Golden Marseillevirus]ALX27439.1 hypothetical protein GMAR_ORF64 [Golden Marseillevirus]
MSDKTNFLDYLPRWLYDDRRIWLSRRRVAIRKEEERQALMERIGLLVPKEQKERLQSVKEEYEIIESALPKPKRD